jgi:hypothetical protein
MTLTDGRFTTDERFSNPFRDAFHAPPRQASRDGLEAPERAS